MDFFIGDFFIIKVWERKNVNAQKKKKKGIITQGITF